jgi:hypothetical protein
MTNQKRDLRHASSLKNVWLVPLHNLYSSVAAYELRGAIAAV